MENCTNGHTAASVWCLTAADSLSAAYRATMATITPATDSTVCQSVRRTNILSVPDKPASGAESFCGSSSVSLGRSAKIGLLGFYDQVIVRFLSGGRAA